LKIATEEKNGVPVLHFDGPISLGPAGDAFDGAVRQAIGKNALVLDLSSVPYIDSTGVATIVANVKRAAERGTQIKLVLAPQGAARKALQITGLDQILEVFVDVQSAVSSLR
jgi:anti-sigma B factor antagonist